MGLYKYLAASKGEAPHEILVEADNSSEALGKLRSRRIVPIKFCGEASMNGNGGFSWRRSKVNTYEFTRQLAPLLESFIPLEKALGIIAESATVPEQKAFVTSLRQGLHEGKKFSELVRSHGSLFPGYYANLIESGEETGCLPEVVNQLYKFMGETKELKDFIVSSSIYPAAILAVTITVTILLFTIFVPRFAKIFIDMNRPMPGSMEFLLGVSAFAFWAWWLIPLALILIWLGLKRALGEEALRFQIHQLLLRVPLLCRIIIDLEMCKYIRTLAILIANHVEIIRTVKISGRIIRNPVIRTGFEDIGRKLKGGEKLSAALSGNRFVPAEMVPMLRVGEESGTVGEMLGRIASHLENDTRLKIKHLLSLFEPAVIVFLALMVLVVVVSIFVAMMEINSINQGGSQL
ncbi:type II secretion system F family protein [Victivallis sp. Marseille-Q1083]|uniref:type II secretion system F family protein n=1 Tax=Victivallis sp. Marseille-Q1083 TaxID=2717288 RepID=UPI00158D1F51|nr:type II secretion system F family protein [Victivallis sp. Marseille-Q1083]